MPADASPAKYVLDFMPGTLSAKAYKGTETVAEHRLVTAAEPVKVALKAEKAHAVNDWDEVVYLTAAVLDAQGVRCPNGREEVTFTIAGPGEIVSVDNGDVYNHERYKSDRQTVYKGEAIAIVRATADKGTITVTASAAGLESSSVTLEAVAQRPNLHNFTATAIDGTEYPLAQFAGKKVMVVNVASKCGLTPQYKSLQALYEKYKDRGLVIVGFPANNFLAQEPGTNEEIRAFCEENYGVTFPMMAKISVKGDDIHPLYAWLTKKGENGVADAEVMWNFQKFLIDAQGNFVRSIDPRTSPDDEEILRWLEQ
jgi:glutathione peroxidase